MIRTRKDNKEREYVAFIDEDGMPNIRILIEKETTDIDGVRVEVPVQKKDFHRFIAETSVIVSGFRTQPEVTGDPAFKPASTDMYDQIDNKGWATIEFDIGSALYSDKQNHILMGGVFYALPDGIMRRVDDFYSLMSITGSLIIPVDIGAFPPAANRETLSLEEHHYDEIVGLINKIVATEQKVTEEKIKVMTHPAEAIEYVDDMFGNAGLHLFSYKGKSLRKWQAKPVWLGGAITFPRLRGNTGVVSLHNSPFALNLHDLKAHRVFGVYADEKSTITTLRKYARGYFERHWYSDRIGKLTTRCLFFSCEMSEHKRNRIQTLIGGDHIEWLSLSEMKAELPDVARNTAAVRNNGQRKNDTIYARTIDCRGHQHTARNVTISDPSCVYWITGDERTIEPHVFGEGIWYIYKNKSNANKIERFGIKPYSALVGEFINNNHDKIMRAWAEDFLSLIYDKNGVLCFKEKFLELLNKHSTNAFELKNVLESVEGMGDSLGGENNCKLLSLVVGFNINSLYGDTFSFPNEHEFFSWHMKQIDIIRERFGLLGRVDANVSSYMHGGDYIETQKEIIRLIDYSLKEKDSTIDMTQAA
jgi:hypothetical protein